ncbi:MAG: hypothetical protein EXS03_08320 [Phycisphaerales bacterium]|nr:hypothetical protein [Phycisphaerales bacterium]
MSLPTFVVSVRSAVFASSVSASIAGASHGALIATYEIGTGPSAASVQIDQEDGDGYLFNIHWDGSAYSSWNTLVDIDAALGNLSLQYDTYSWGILLTGVSIDGDSDYGTGDLWPIKNYWHFWVRDSGSWEWAMFGATDRALFSGAHDAWVFGSPSAPQSIPAPGAAGFTLASAGACRALRRRVRTTASRVR